MVETHEFAWIMIAKKGLLCTTLLGVILLVISCEPKPYSSWLIHWDILNVEDSVLVTPSLNYSIIVEPCKNGDCIVSDTIRNGYLERWFIFSELKKDVLSQNRTLSCMIFENDIIVYDSTYLWNDLDFEMPIIDPQYPESSSLGNYQEIYLEVSR